MRQRLLPTPEKPARRLRHKQAAQHKQHARRQRNPEDPPPRLILEPKQRCRVCCACHRLDTVTEIDAHHRRRHDSQRQQPLEGAGSLAPVARRQTLRQIQWNHHADQPAAHALKQPSEEKRPIPLRKGNHRNAHNERKSAENHQRLAAQPVGEHSREQR